MYFTALIISLNIASILTALFLLATFLLNTTKQRNAGFDDTLSAERQVHVMQDSYDISLAILKDFERKASQILHKFEELKGLNTKDINQLFKEIVSEELHQLQIQSSQNMQTFQIDIQKERDNYLLNLKTISEDIMEQYKQILEVFKSELRSKYVESEQSIHDQTSQQLDILEKDIRSYKNSRMETIDTIVVSVLDKTINKFLTQKIEIKQHEEILKKILNEEKIKSELLFRNIA